MLILIRHLGEAIKVGELGEITVTILGVRGNQVRVGIEAPKEIPVHRFEIYERIVNEKKNKHRSHKRRYSIEKAEDEG